LFSFHPDQDYHIIFHLTGDQTLLMSDKTIYAQTTGNTEDIYLPDLLEGSYTMVLEVYDANEELLMIAQKDFIYSTTGTEDLLSDNDPVYVTNSGDKSIQVSFREAQEYHIRVFNINGQLINRQSVNGTTAQLNFPTKGLYILNISGTDRVINKKIVIN
jgi:hypothetical protein